MRKKEDDKPTYGMLKAKIEMLENQNAELFTENHKVKHLREVLVGLDRLASTFIAQTDRVTAVIDDLDERIDGIHEALKKKRRDR